jgi:hypothetical protein
VDGLRSNHDRIAACAVSASAAEPFDLPTHRPAHRFNNRFSV